MAGSLAPLHFSITCGTHKINAQTDQHGLNHASAALAAWSTLSNLQPRNQQTIEAEDMDRKETRDLERHGLLGQDDESKPFVHPIVSVERHHHICHLTHVSKIFPAHRNGAIAADVPRVARQLSDSK